MPFTPSHAAVSLAFLRTPLPPAAVAVGAMTPDLPLFVPVLPIGYPATHSLLAVPFTAVVAAALLALWYGLLRPAARELAPRPLAERLPEGWDRFGVAALRDSFGGVRRTVLVLLALVIGVLSHIAWDAFTHAGRLGSALIPALAEQWGPFEGYRWLQYLSSAAGLVLLALCGWIWLRRRPAVAATRVLPGIARPLWWLSLPALLGIGWLLGLTLLGPLDAEFTARHLAYRVLPPACAAFGAVTVLLALVVQLRRAGQAAGSQPHGRGGG